jgi:hypothetical protein
VSRVLAWLLVAALVAHGVGLANGFVYDDHRFVAENPALDELTPAGAFLDPSTHTADADRDVYRPLRALGHAFDAGRWGRDPFGFHLHSLLAHLLAVALGYGLLRSSLGEAPAVLGAGMLAVHPAGVEVVGWVSSRGDQYALIGGLAALWISFPERAGKTRGTALALATLAAGFATLGKESAAVLPAVALLRDRLILRRGRVAEPLALALGVCGALLLRQWALEGATPVQVPPHGGSAITQVGWSAYGLSRLGEHLLLPSQLTVDPPQAQWAAGGGPFTRPLTWLGFALLASPFILARRSRTAAFLLGWALLAWLPSGSLLVTLRTLVTDRAAYPMLLPLGAALGLAAPRLGTRWPAVVVALLALLAVSSVDRTRDFQSDAALWEDVLTKHPQSTQAHLGLAAVSSDPVDAEALLARAAGEAAPGSKERAVALARWGDHLLGPMNDPAAASQVLAEAVAALQDQAAREGRASGDLPASVASLAESLDRLGRHDEAEAMLRAAAATSDQPARMLLKWALLLRVRADSTGDPALAAEADAVLAEAERAGPDDPLVDYVRASWGARRP